MFVTMVVHEEVFTCLDLVPQRTNAAADSFLFYERVRATVVASLGKQGHYVHWKQAGSLTAFGIRFGIFSVQQYPVKGGLVSGNTNKRRI